MIATGLTDMRGTTAPRLHLELMCARVLLPGADVDERGLHARLDRIERRLDMVGGASLEAAATPQPAATQLAAGSTVGAAAGGRRRGPGARQPQRPPAATGGRGPGGPCPGGSGRRPVAVRPGRRRPSPYAPSSRPCSRGTRTSRSPEHGAAARAARRARPRRAARPTTRWRANGGRRRRPGPRPGRALTATDVRRLWPEVLEEVKSKRRFTWILLSQNAQVAEVRDGTLLLAMANTGARDSFGRGGSEDVLREALVVVLGTDFRIETMVDAGSAGAGGTSSREAPGRPPAPAAPAARRRRCPTTRRSGRPRCAPGPSARERAVASVQSAGPAAVVDPDEAVDRDDADVDDGAESHQALLMRQLGAQVIVEDDA